MSQKIGYARISSTSQNIESQLDALRAAGCEKLFTDTASGIKQERQGWDALMEYIRPQDTLIVTELSRMSRSLLHLLQLVAELEKREIALVSLREHIDTSTATGRCFLSMMGAMAQMERELRAERTAAGRAAAKARGRTGGRPCIDRDRLEQARILYHNSEKSASEVSKLFGCSPSTLFSYMREVKEKEAVAS